LAGTPVLDPVSVLVSLFHADEAFAAAVFVGA
jgi:hypothetical protein